MHIGQRTGYLPEISQRLVLRQAATFGNAVIESPAVAIFHYIVTRAVGIEAVYHFHNTRIVKAGKAGHFVGKLAPELVEQFLVTRSYRSTRPTAHSKYKKLFHNNWHINLYLANSIQCYLSVGQIGDVVCPLPQQTVNAVSEIRAT